MEAAAPFAAATVSSEGVKAEEECAYSARISADLAVTSTWVEKTIS